jgi:hypothetical protein
MPTFSIEAKGYNIITCTQVQTVTFVTFARADINKAGDGRIKLSASNPDEAINMAKKRLEAYKNS